MNVKEAITKRHSTRVFNEKHIPKELMEMIIQYAYRIPSAGNLRPLNLAVAVFEKTPDYILICADYDKTTVKYGDRGIMYVHMEAGHAAQNICLICEEMGLASCCIGAFDGKEVRARFKLESEPIYMVAVGYPKAK